MFDVPSLLRRSWRAALPAVALMLLASCLPAAGGGPGNPIDLRAAPVQLHAVAPGDALFVSAGFGRSALGYSRDEIRDILPRDNRRVYQNRTTSARVGDLRLIEREVIGPDDVVTDDHVDLALDRARVVRRVTDQDDRYYYYNERIDLTYRIAVAPDAPAGRYIVKGEVQRERGDDRVPVVVRILVLGDAE